MKKWWLILFCFMLIGCDAISDELLVETEVISIDDSAHHNIKSKKYSESIPHLIRLYSEAIDDVYNDFYIETYDRDTKMVWSLRINDLLINEIPSDDDVVIYEDKVIINAGGIISVHDILTGDFKWELETSRDDTNYAIHRGLLYVLYCEEDLITGINLENGKKELHIDVNHSKKDYIGIIVDATSIVVHKEKSNYGIKNSKALEYTLGGEFVKNTNYRNVDKISSKVTWNKIVTSSSLVENSEENLIDTSVETVWSEGVKGYGEKEWIEIQRPLPTIINELVIVNGNQTSMKNFKENAKLKKAIINIGNAKTLKYVFPVGEYGKVTVLKFIQPIISDYIYITIEESEPGSLYKNTYITDIYTK